MNALMESRNLSAATALARSTAHGAWGEAWRWEGSVRGVGGAGSWLWRGACDFPGGMNPWGQPVSPSVTWHPGFPAAGRGFPCSHAGTVLLGDSALPEFRAPRRGGE